MQAASIVLPLVVFMTAHSRWLSDIWCSRHELAYTRAARVHTTHLQRGIHRSHRVAAEAGGEPEARAREASDLREKANRVFKVTGNAEIAEKMYTRCIELDGADWMAHSNRAAVRSCWLFAALQHHRPAADRWWREPLNSQKQQARLHPAGLHASLDTRRAWVDHVKCLAAMCASSAQVQLPRRLRLLARSPCERFKIRCRVKG